MTDPEIVTDFELVWRAFPRKVGKGAARKVWAKLRPDTALVQQMLDTLAWQVHQPQWTKESGQYIPHFQTWLRQERWTDEPVSVLPAHSLLPSPDKYAATSDYHRRMREGREGVH